MTFTPQNTVTRTSTPTPTPTQTPTNTPTHTPLYPVIDPYKCYKAKPVGDVAEERLVTYTDEFEKKRSRILKPFMVCNPAAASDPLIPVAQVTPPPLFEPMSRLTCYKVKDERRMEDQAPFSPKTVNLRTRVEVHTESGVCCKVASCVGSGDDLTCTDCDSESMCASNAQCTGTDVCAGLVDADERYELIKPFVMCIPSLRELP